MKQTFLFLLLLAFNYGLSQEADISVISVEKANIVYRGIMNPIKIAVPGAKSYTVTSNGELKKKDSLGNYLFNVNGTIGKVAKIVIAATMENGSIVKEEKEFELRDIPRRKANITGAFTNKVYEMTFEELEHLEIKIPIDDLAFTLDSVYSKPLSFKIKAKGYEDLWVKGNKMTSKIFSYIKKLPIGTELLIDYIRQYNPYHMRMIPIPPIKIRIVEPKNEYIFQNTPIPEIASEYGNIIIYREIENVLNINVRNSKKIKAKATGLKMLPDSTYTINVGKTKKDKIYIDFEITMQNDSVIHTKEMLYVKDRDTTPKKITLNGKGCSDSILKMTLAELKDAVVDIRIDDEESSWSNVVVDGFDINLPDGDTIYLHNDKITDQAFQKLSNLNNKATFEISVPYYIAFGFTYPPPPLKIMIVDKS